MIGKRPIEDDLVREATASCLAELSDAEKRRCLGLLFDKYI